ncbi:REP-associated tyrosine transposase [Fibrella aquatica]|jgi:putative transposase|uniref:REP-associated tyrosine transposase n=1 Tax=Fibrella aquatica TaxID=3242487 RepID=UPI003521DD4E
MALRNPISEGYMYFLTLTVVDWVDVFTRPTYKQDIVDSLAFCQANKGLELYAWVLMTNHLHLLASAAEGFSLSDILRDFKKFTSKKITNRILMEPESRRKWMLNQFEFAGRHDTRITNFKFWQDGNEPKEIHTNEFMFQKLHYIHDNPVRAGVVEYPEQYLHSSARTYVGNKGLLDVIVL